MNTVTISISEYDDLRRVRKEMHALAQSAQKQVIVYRDSWHDHSGEYYILNESDAVLKLIKDFENLSEQIQRMSKDLAEFNNKKYGYDKKKRWWSL